MDKMNIEVLADGTIKVDTDAISAQQHMSAEAFMRNLATVAGGKQERRHKAGVVHGLLHDLRHVLAGHGADGHTH